MSQFTDIVQVGIVARDKARVLEHMEKVLGAVPSRTLLTIDDDARVYRGEKGDFSAELIFYQFGAVELEFIIPLEGKSIWRDFLEDKGEGLHHVKFNVGSFEDSRKQMSEAGIGMMQEGNSATGIPGLKWGYFDSTGLLDFIVEIGNRKEVDNA